MLPPPVSRRPEGFPEENARVLEPGDWMSLRLSCVEGPLAQALPPPVVSATRGAPRKRIGPRCYALVPLAGSTPPQGGGRESGAPRPTVSERMGAVMLALDLGADARHVGDGATTSVGTITPDPIETELPVIRELTPELRLVLWVSIVILHLVLGAASRYGRALTSTSTGTRRSPAMARTGPLTGRTR